MDQEERVSLSAAGFVFKRVIPWMLLLGMVYYIFLMGRGFLNQQPQEETNPLVVSQSKQSKPVKSYGTAIILSQTVNFRKKPSVTAPRIDRLTKGTKLTVIGKPNSKWFRVQTAQGIAGYITSSPIDVKFVPKK